MSSTIDTALERFQQYLRYSNLDSKPYQYDGVKWCLTNEMRENPRFGVRGGFIADEMGLGKTITMIGTLVSNLLPRTLIVVPPILIDQWDMQILRTLGHKPLIFHGPNKKTITLDTLNKSTIVICSYAGITLSKPQLEHKIEPSILHKLKWDRIIFDESHHMRNSTTKLYRSAIRMNATIRWLVSGTPVQNSKQDLYNLCSLIQLPVDFYVKKENLNELATNYILKRTKKHVGISIPELTQDNKTVEWTNKAEKDLSLHIHSTLDFAGTTKQGPINRLFDKIYEGKGAKLAMLIKAKQACIMPQLISSSISKHKKKIDISQYKDAFHHTSKIDSIVQFIYNRRDNRAGKILFCNYREEIDTFTQRLQHLGLKTEYIDGRVNLTKRKIILSKPYDVLILQIQTGCEGLNLQENYSEIYFVSPTWNPAVEDQAIARCHRIGQSKPVHVFRFLMDYHSYSTSENLPQGQTIESYTREVQDHKRELADTLIK